MSFAQIKLDDDDFQQWIRKMVAKGTDTRPLRQDIGEALAETTKQRFGTSTAPDGSAWAPNAPATILSYLAKFRGSFGRSGRITRRGAARGAGKRPLIGESGRLSREIFYRLGSDNVEIGSGLPYAAIQQFGGKAGRGKRVTIPARAFLGLSLADRRTVSDLAKRYLGK